MHMLWLSYLRLESGYDCSYDDLVTMILVVALLFYNVICVASSYGWDALLSLYKTNQTSTWCNEALPFFEEDRVETTVHQVCSARKATVSGVYPHNIIRCNGTDIFVLRYFCVTFDKNNNVTLTGPCLVSQRNRTSNIGGTLSYQEISINSMR